MCGFGGQDSLTDKIKRFGSKISFATAGQTVAVSCLIVCPAGTKFFEIPAKRQLAGNVIRFHNMSMASAYVEVTLLYRFFIDSNFVV